MKQKFFFNALAVCMMALTLVSCKKDDKNEPGPNVLEDPNGLLTNLTWTLNGSSNPGTDADLDIYLYKGTGAGKTPTPYFSDDVNTNQEMFTMPSTLADGDYTLTVDFLEANFNGMMTFTFNPTTNGGSYSINNVSFTTAAAGTEKDVVKINKSGNKFTITQL